ncbi:MAG: extracellular solute-binding protein [Candidatus Limiplasma sp.]|nr:extracellular solute-binding protein [Candidatus Limiplasma sp.]
MKNRKKWMAVFTVMTLFATLLSGLATAFAGEAADIEIFTRFADGASKAYFDELATTFMNENPGIKVTVTSADNQNYKQEINVRLASNDTPDIYFAWSGIYAKNFVNGGRALDLKPYLDADTEWSGKIIASQFGPFTFEGKVYGIPIIMDGKAFYYNKEIFGELGLEVPQNWSEFLPVLQKLAETEYIPISLGNSEDWATGHYMTTLNQRVVPAEALARDYALESEASFSDPAYVEALHYLNELVPYFTPNFNAVGYDEGISDFINGKAAIYYEQFNQVQYIEPAQFEWSWFDFPDIQGAAGDQQALTGAPQGFMVSATTEYPDACVAFLKYMTSVDNAAKMVKDTSMISTVDGAINADTASEKMIQIAETIKQASSINPWLDNVTHSEVVAVYLADIQAMVGGQMTAEEVMADVQGKAAEVKAE